MSEERVEGLRRGYEAFNRGDFDAVLEIIHPEFEFQRAGGQSALRGVDAFRAWMEPEVLEDVRIEPVEFRSSGNKVLVRQKNWARGAGSGIELEDESWAVWTLNEDGLAIHVRAFRPQDRTRAFEAAGLSA